MCGIFISNSPLVSESNLDIIEACLRFRGPDAASGLVRHENWSVYHSRLSIIDVNSGVNQPVIDSTGGVLVFNGEILNYKELGLKYFNIEYRSDSILLSDLIAAKKMKPEELDGFFAFVYVDAMGVLKHACRDRFGVKPLFYCEDDHQISFSSEPRLLKELFKLPVNEDSIDEYYATRAPIFSGSFFKSVKSVNPGNCLVTGEYFDCRKHLGSEYTKVSEDSIESALKISISTRMVSDAPVGLLLSRGVDSNLINELGSFNNLYTIGFKGDEDIEYLRTKKISNLKIVECREEQYLESFRHLLKLRGEPMSVPNEVLLFRVAQEASKDGVKVLLSGEGADEFFGGYDRVYSWAARAQKFDIDKFLELYCYNPPRKESSLYNKFSELFSATGISDAFEIVRWFFIRYHLPVLFRRLDFALMAAGVEGREPIANQHIFEQAVKLSKTELIGKRLGKIPLRKTVEKYLGVEFAFEKKVGFPVDLTKIFDNPEGLTSYELWFRENLEVLK